MGAAKDLFPNQRDQFLAIVNNELILSPTPRRHPQPIWNRAQSISLANFRHLIERYLKRSPLKIQKMRPEEHPRIRNNQSSANALETAKEVRRFLNEDNFTRL
jgi:hypothetical protein